MIIKNIHIYNFIKFQVRIKKSNTLNNSHICFKNYIIKLIKLKKMGEAKRRQRLNIPPRKKIKDIKESDRYISWLPISKTRIKKYPYMGVVTMALGAIIFLASGGFNTI